MPNIFYMFTDLRPTNYNSLDMPNFIYLFNSTLVSQLFPKCIFRPPNLFMKMINHDVAKSSSSPSNR